jgi:hypothetical protein
MPPAPIAAPVGDGAAAGELGSAEGALPVSAVAVTNGVGSGVGFGVGLAVGFGVGRGVGLGVGFGVGFGVGLGVGVGVAVGVGVGVGAETVTGLGLGLLSVREVPAWLPVNWYEYEPTASVVV